jgi:hypothetical protein
MSAIEPSGRSPSERSLRRDAGIPPPPMNGARPSTTDMSHLRARRRAARRRSRLARLDLGLGVVAALVLLVASPGAAMTAVIALLALVLCVVSLAGERWIRRRRSQRTERMRRAGRSGSSR